MTNDPARALLMRVIDGEHSAADLRELERLAAASREIRDEWTRLARVKEATSTMTWQHPPDEIWDRYWMSVYNRLERKVAWLLMIAGGLAVAAWALWEAAPGLLRSWFERESLPIAIRVAVVAVGLGAIMLVFSVVREQVMVRRKERYDKGVVR